MCKKCNHGHESRGDVSLVRGVFTEIFKGHQIRANLSRYGGLSVFVYEDDYDSQFNCLWQGENILEARAWIEKSIQLRAAERQDES